MGEYPIRFGRGSGWPPWKKESEGDGREEGEREGREMTALLHYHIITYLTFSRR